MIRFSPNIPVVNFHGSRLNTIQGVTKQLQQVPDNDYIMGEFRQEISTGKFRLINPTFSFPLWGVWSGDSNGQGTPLKVKAALEFSTSFTPLKFAGNLQIDGVNGTNVTTDSLGFDIPPNTNFRLRCAIQVPTVDDWFYDGGHGGGRYSNRTIDNVETYATGGFVGAGSGLLSYGYGSIACVGGMYNGKSVAIHGDSISEGIGGFGAVGLDNLTTGRVPWCNYARSFEYLQTFVGAGGAKRRALLPNHSHVLMMFGTNDLGGSFSFSTVRDWFLTAFSQCKADGRHMTVCTILPRTSGNVVVDSDYAPGGVRDQLNAFLKSQVGITVDAVIDTAAAVENPSDHTLWNLAMTGDETHLSTLGRDTCAALVTAHYDALFA